MITFFSLNSFVDFLSFCFGVNTLFSVVKINKKTLNNFERQIDSSFRNKIDIFSTSIENISDCIGEIESVQTLSRNTLEKFKKHQASDSIIKKIFTFLSTILSIFFLICAIISGILIVFSDNTVVKEYYLWSILLLCPVVLYGIIYLAEKICLRRVFRTWEKDFKQLSEKSDLLNGIANGIKNKKT